MNYNGYRDGFTLGKRNFGSDTVNQSVAPVTYVELEKNTTNQKWYPSTKPLRAAATMMNVQHFSPTSLTYSGNWYMNRGYALWFDRDNYDPPLSFETPQGEEVFRSWFRWRINLSGYFGYSLANPTFKNFMWPSIWTDVEQGHSYLENELTYNTSALLPAAESVTTGWFGRGVTFTVLDPSTSTSQMNYFLYMMLGRKTNKKVNAGYKVNNGSQTYDFSETDDVGYLDVQLNRANLSQPLWTDKSTDGYRADENYVPASTTTLTLTLPLWPTLKLKNINSNYFAYDDNPLQIGAGLPIAKNIMSNGTLHISASYTTNRIISTHENVGLILDVAHASFTGEDDDTGATIDYYDGYDSDVDPDATDKTLKRMKDLVISKDNTSFHLTIPVRKEDDVWLRVAPNTTDGGYYAKLSNLSITFDTN